MSDPADDDVHFFEGAAIEEGDRPPPRWYLLFVAIVVAVFLLYLGHYLIGAQPSSAQLR